MKATTLLTKQHAEVKAIFKKLEGGKGDAKALLESLADNLCAHMKIEQDIFYPAVKRIKEDLVLESFEEHAMAELALKRLLGADTSSPTFKAKVTTLKEMIEHHVKEEEQDLFPKVEKVLEAEALEAMGKQMKADFDDAMAQGHAELLPRAFASTTADAANKVRSSNGHTVAPAKSKSRAAHA